MAVWRSDIERDAFVEKHCRVCYGSIEEVEKRIFSKGGGCLLLLAAAAGKLPLQWKRRRDGALGNTYRCSSFLPKSPVNRRAVAPDKTLPLFDAPSQDYVPLVPVAGWPDRPRKRDVNHQ